VAGLTLSLPVHAANHAAHRAISALGGRICLPTADSDNVRKTAFWFGVNAFLSIPSVVGAIAFYGRLGATHTLFDPLLVVALTAWATLSIDRLWRTGVPQTWFLRMADFATDMLARRGGEGPFHALAFIRVPKGEEPPEPKYACGRRRASPKHPWSRNVPRGEGDLWAARSFVAKGASDVYEAMSPVKWHAWGEQYSSDDTGGWHADERTQTDKYVRFREKPAGDLSVAIPLDPRAPTPEWTRLARLLTGTDTPVKTWAIPPMRMTSLRRLRIVFEPSSGWARRVPSISTVFDMPGRLAPASGNRLKCIFGPEDASAVLQAGQPTVPGGLHSASPTRGIQVGLVFSGGGDTADSLTMDQLSGPTHLRPGTVSIYFK